MDTSNLSQLEERVSQMLQVCQQLQQENRRLKADRDILLDKNRVASQKIEAMIEKLKKMS